MSETEKTQLRRSAMDLLARREHSRRELLDKLQRRSASRAVGDPSVVEAVVSQLTAEGLQSDIRFAESFMRGRAGRGYGPRRIRLELIQRGVSRELADEALAKAGLDWSELMHEVLSRRFGGSAPADARERFKRLRYLQERGFDVSGEVQFASSD